MLFVSEFSCCCRLFSKAANNFGSFPFTTCTFEVIPATFKADFVLVSGVAGVLSERSSRGLTLKGSTTTPGEGGRGDSSGHLSKNNIERVFYKTSIPSAGNPFIFNGATAVNPFLKEESGLDSAFKDPA